jgi:hypothetical protein
VRALRLLHAMQRISVAVLEGQISCEPGECVPAMKATAE